MNKSNWKASGIDDSSWLFLGRAGLNTVSAVTSGSSGIKEVLSISSSNSIPLNPFPRGRRHLQSGTMPNQLKLVFKGAIIFKQLIVFKSRNTKSRNKKVLIIMLWRRWWWGYPLWRMQLVAVHSLCGHRQGDVQGTSGGARQHHMAMPSLPA